MASRSEVVILIIILLLGLILRLVCLESASLTPSFKILDLDSDLYHAWAAVLASGGATKSPAFEMAPLYPYLLSLLYSIFGPFLYVVRVFQLLEGMMVIFLTWVVGRRIGGKFHAPIAAFIVALCGPLILYEQVLLSSTTVTLLLMVSVALLDGSFEKKPSLSFAAGFFIGIAALGQPGFMLIPNKPA